MTKKEADKLRGMANENWSKKLNPYEHMGVSRLTLKDIETNRIPEGKVEVRVPHGADARRITHELGIALRHLGIEIRIRDNYNDDLGFAMTSTFRDDIVIMVTRMSDEMMDRHRHEIHYQEIQKKIEIEKMKLEEIEKQRREAEEKSKREKKKRLAAEENRRTKEAAMKQRKLEELDKEPSYQEKIKWFCDKYGEQYDIILESFKDDNLNNLFWKGEKVNFPKKRK